MKPLITKFKKSLKGKTLFLGIGNFLKSDDVAGIVLLEKIKDSIWAKSITAEFWNCSVSPENYLEKILRNNFDTIVIIDALHMNKQAGKIDLVDPEKITSFSISTHSLSPKMFIDYLNNSKTFNILFLGIQPKTTDFKEGLTPEVSSSIDEFVDCLLKE